MNTVEIIYRSLLKIGALIFQGIGIFILAYLVLIIKEIHRHATMKKKTNNVVYINEYKKSDLQEASH